jgi:DNA-binding CsgD family transcriptional regulator
MMSFEENLHRTVLTADGPAQALQEAVAVIEVELAPAGSLLYRCDASALVVPLAGSLYHAFMGDLSWCEDDPCQDRGRLEIVAPLVHATRLVPRRPHTASTAYREFYAKHEIEHIVCLRLDGRPHATPGMHGLFLGRGGAHGDFAEPHKRHLLAALPVLAALSRARARLEQLRQVLDGLGSAIEVRQALLVLSAEGEPLWRSGPARALLQAAPRGRIEAFFGAARQLVTELGVSGRPRRAVAVELGPAGAWALEISPLSAGALYLARLRPARDPEARLAERYRLTPAEAAVLSCLGEGMSNAEIGASLSITSATAATHVKRVLAKLGVASRVLAALLMQREQLLDDSGAP